MRLSIIVPVYNVEPYLEKCLDSLLDQNIDKSQYEILVLNDGSTDKSLEIVHKYADKYSNIQEFSHPNKGLSGTRNVGLKNATGDYVWFVDSDDWIEKDCLKGIIEKLKDNPEVLSFSGMIPEGNRIGKADFYDERVKDLEDLFYYGMTDPVQFYIYNRQFLISNNFYFKEGIKHEDTLFTPITLYNVQKLAFYRGAVYHLLCRPGSITTVTDIKRIVDLADNIRILYDFSKKIKEPKIKLGFKNKMAHRITEMLNYGIANGKKGEELVRQIMNEHPEYWSIMKTAIDKKPRCIYYIIRNSPFSFIATYRFLVNIKQTFNNFF